MKNLTTLITILFVSLLSSPSWGEELTINDLVTRDNLYYKRFTDIPFTGEVGGLGIGKFKDGKRDGLWEVYYEKNKLNWKGNFIFGEKDGLWTWYTIFGQLHQKGNYNKDKKEGLWVGYFDDGQLEFRGNYVNGEKNGPWKSNKKLGFKLLHSKGNYKNGLKDGFWEVQNIVYDSSGHYKGGKEHGLWETIYKTGQLWVRGNYIVGKKDGLWEKFKKDGSLEKTETWKNGVKVK